MAKRMMAVGVWAAFFCAAGFGFEIPRNGWRGALAGAAAEPSGEKTEWRGVRVDRSGMITPLWKYDRNEKNYIFGFPKFSLDEAGECDAVMMDFPHLTGNATVFVNGKRAGAVEQPAGFLMFDRSLAKPGAANNLEIHFTQEKLAYFAPHLYPPQMRSPKILPVRGARLTDVFANPSWRKKTLTMESEIYAVRAGTAEVSYEILDEGGKTVKAAKARVELKPGMNRSETAIPWKDFTAWEFGRPYLYTCRAAVTAGKARTEYGEFKFGMREAWVEGKEIWMNGHIQRLRPVYSYNAGEAGARMFRELGYNVAAYCHVHAVLPDRPSEECLEAYDRVGIGCAAPMPTPAWVGSRGSRVLEPESAEHKSYARAVERHMKRLRNHPSVMWVFTSMLINWDLLMQHPTYLGQPANGRSQVGVIEKARELGKKYLPGAIYSGFGDGNSGDVCSSFNYMNWTPMQEREDWLSLWAEKGAMPVFFGEFGQPYHGNWWMCKCFLPTEWAAPHFGDEAYLKETEEGVDSLMALSLANGGHPHAHGAPKMVDPALYPTWGEMERLYMGRTARSWRGWGVNGGMIYFKLHAPWGVPTGVSTNATYVMYSAMEKDYKGGKPAWATESFDVYKDAVREFLPFLGGWPAHTAKEHSYRGGETVEKSVNLIWDGFGKRKVKVEWRAELDGEELAAGAKEFVLETGANVRERVAFRLPKKVRKVKRGTLTAKFTSVETGESETDRLEFEAYPPADKDLGFDGTVALLDPKGKTAELLKAAGVKYRLLQPGDGEFAKYSHLVVGRFGLDNAQIPATAKAIAEGKSVLVMAQAPDVLKELGFRAEDIMSRGVNLRDERNPAFEGVEDRMLKNWRGAPDYGKPFGNITVGRSPRYRRWTRNHTVAGALIRIPEKIGFIPLADGEFDMNYSPLLEFRNGKGTVLYSTFDFEERDGDPAAERTFLATLKEFFRAKKANGKTLEAVGAEAKRMLEKCGADIVENGDIAVLDNSAKTEWSEIVAKAKEGKIYVVVDNTNLVKAAGLKTRAKKFRRLGKMPEGAGLLRGIGPSLFRCREAVDVLEIEGGEGFKTFAGGMVACKSFGGGFFGGGKKGAVVFLQLDPLALDRRHKAESDERCATFLSVERGLQLLARMLTNLGAKPGADLARRVVRRPASKDYVPIGSYYVLGPFAKDTVHSAAILNEKFSGEEAAAAGNTAPEQEYKLPQGGTVNWRSTITAGSDGVVDFRWLGGRYAETPRAAVYAVYHFDRETDQPATLKINPDWACKVWCNGEPVFFANRPSPVVGYEFMLKNLKKGPNTLTFKLAIYSESPTRHFSAFISPEKKAGAEEADEEPVEVKMYEDNYKESWDEYHHRPW